MQKKIIHNSFSFFIISTLLMVGCGTAPERSNNPSIIQNETIITATQEITDIEELKTHSDTKEADISLHDNDTNEYPNTVKNCYNSYKEVLNNHFPQYTLSEINEDTVNDSIFFTFNININKDSTQPQVTFQNDEASFDISLPNNIDNEIIKNIILCTIMSAESSIDKNSANELMQNLSNSFDGSNNSNVISTNNYKFYISAGSGLSLRRLNIISVSEINPPINKAEYVQATNNLFNGELNQGAKAYIQGTILGIYDLGTHWGLEISNGVDTYALYYNYNNFIDCFEIGNTYTFYGQIAAIKKGYSGCLRLDYISSEE